MSPLLKMTFFVHKTSPSSNSRHIPLEAPSELSHVTSHVTLCLFAGRRIEVPGRLGVRLLQRQGFWELRSKQRKVFAQELTMDLKFSFDNCVFI